ncbi:MAG: alpha/beta hydrolase, partial [Bacteroidia bacterium]|nr:alpha/beta hydrolase [Bacteroidia bacterium]
MKNSIIVATIYLLTLLSCNPRTDNSSGVSSKYQETNYGENLEAGRYLHVRGFKFYYETYGEGEPLLLIHGNEGSIHDFHRNIPYFSSTYKVIAADSRSQGKSTDNADSLSYEMMAEDFRVLLDSLQIDSCNIIGWSDGGIIGLLLAIYHPDKVKKLAISGANLWADTSALTPYFFNWIHTQIDSLSQLTQTPETKNTFKLISLMRDQPNISLEQLNNIKCPT